MKKSLWHALFFILVSVLLVSTGENAIGETDSIREAREKKQDASNRRADAAAVLKMAELNIQHPTGDVPPDLWPAQLDNKLTVRTPPPPQFNAGRGK